MADMVLLGGDKLSFSKENQTTIRRLTYMLGLQLSNKNLVMHSHDKGLKPFDLLYYSIIRGTYTSTEETELTSFVKEVQSREVLDGSARSHAWQKGELTLHVFCKPWRARRVKDLSGAIFKNEGGYGVPMCEFRGTRMSHGDVTRYCHWYSSSHLLLMDVETITDFDTQISPLMHLLGSYNPPSESEVTLTRAVETRVSKTATQSVDRLSSDNPLKILHPSLKCPISPIHTLPPEIIFKIFRMCMPLDTPWNHLDLRAPPWTLARVCYIWREIALREQKIWSCISFERFGSMGMLFGNEHQYERTLPMLKACIERSGQRLFSLNLSEWINLHPFLVRELCLHSDRWESLSFHPQTGSFEPPESIKGPFPELYELSIIKPRFTFAMLEPNLGGFDLFEVAPKLRKATIYFFVGLERTLLWVFPSKLKLPWHQLTNLETDCIDILERCHNLVDCQLIATYQQRSLLLGTLPLVEVPNLRTLLVNDVTNLDSLTLPSLELLSVQGQTSIITIEYVCSLVLRCKCALRTLDLTRAPVHTTPKPDFMELVATCTDLHTLLISAADVEFVIESGIPLSGWHVDPKISSDSVKFYKDNGQVA